jgi:Methylated DNA-protein cysteine methyltransferase
MESPVGRIRLVASEKGLAVAPCHQVIGVSGKLAGYAGGLENKALLLRLEQN